MSVNLFWKIRMRYTALFVPTISTCAWVLFVPNIIWHVFHQLSSRMKFCFCRNSGRLSRLRFTKGSRDIVRQDFDSIPGAFAFCLPVAWTVCLREMGHIIVGWIRVNCYWKILNCHELPFAYIFCVSCPVPRYFTMSFQMRSVINLSRRARRWAIWKTPLSRWVGTFVRTKTAFGSLTRKWPRKPFNAVCLFSPAKGKVPLVWMPGLVKLCPWPMSGCSSGISKT